MIYKNISFTPRDYDIMCDIASRLHYIVNDTEVLEEISNKIALMSIWDGADISCSEIDFGNMFRIGDYARCIKDNKTHDFKLVNRVADKNDIICIIKGSNTIDNCFVGKYYIVSDRKYGKSRIRLVDTYGNCGERYLSLNDDQYIVLEKLEDRSLLYGRN